MPAPAERAGRSGISKPLKGPVRACSFCRFLPPALSVRGGWDVVRATLMGLSCCSRPRGQAWGRGICRLRASSARPQRGHGRAVLSLMLLLLATLGSAGKRASPLPRPLLVGAFP